MDMKSLLEKMMKFAGEPDQTPGDQVRGIEKAKTGGKDHPFKGRLVGDGVEPQGNMLEELSQESKDKTIEWDLVEAWEEFKEAAFKDTETKRKSRKGSRPEREYTKDGEQSNRYVYNEGVDSDESSVITTEVIKLISDGHTEVSPDVITAKVSAALGRPFMLKDLVSANNASPELQHYIDSINPSKIKFSTDILTVKNQDPMKEKQAAQDGVAKMAARAGNRPRLGESAQYSWSIKDEQGKGGVYHRVASDEQVIAKDIAYTKKSNPGSKVVATKDGKPFDWESALSEGWNTGSDRVHLDDSSSAYWEGKGPLQKEYEALYDQLVPAQGKADTVEGEVLRAASKIYYRHFNDGDEFNQASFGQLEQYIGKVNSYDDLAHKATEFALKANGEYHPNADWDSLDVMDYGPEDYSDDYDEDDDWEDEWYEEPEEDEDEDLEEGVADQVYTVDITRRDRTRSTSGTMAELLDYFGYTLEVGKSYEHERGRYKINMNPKNIQSLVDNLNKAASNGAANGAASTYYSVGGEQPVSSVEPEETYGDGEPYFKEEVDEGWESGPEEYKEPYDDADDAYDRRRQEKLDIEAEKANAKRPQTKVYTLLGRGPNMEPNYKFPGEYDSLDAAVAARKELMNKPDTPHPEHIGISTHTRYLDEGRDTPLRDLEDYSAKKKALQDIQLDPSTSQDPELSAELAQRLARLNQQYSELKEMVNRVKESRGHKIIATKLKDIERSKQPVSDKAYAQHIDSIKAQQKEYLKKNPKSIYKQVDEVGANQPTGTAGQKMNDPVQARNIQQATQTLKTSTGSSAPATNITKALDAASQGKGVSSTDMKVLEPLMKDLTTVAQDPKLANQFKTLANQVNQAQKKTTP